MAALSAGKILKPEAAGVTRKDTIPAPMQEMTGPAIKYDKQTERDLLHEVPPKLDQTLTIEGHHSSRSLLTTAAKRGHTIIFERHCI